MKIYTHTPAYTFTPTPQDVGGPLTVLVYGMHSLCTKNVSEGERGETFLLFSFSTYS